MSEPDIYLRSKVPEDMYDTLQKFAEIRKLDRQSLVRDFNLYPTAQNLLTLERKYGDSLTLFDLNGVKPKKARKPKVDLQTGNLINDGKSDGLSYDTKTRMSDGETMTLKSAKLEAQPVKN